jgi:hypothetical protein
VVATVVAAIIDMVSPSQFGATWRLARLELLEPLGREPSPEEIAAHLRKSPTLRWLAGVAAETPIAGLVARATRGMFL